MKKKTKNLLVLAGVLVVLLIGYVTLTLFLEADAKQQKEAMKANLEIIEFKAEDITFCSYENTEYEVGFYITGDTYVHYKEEGFPVNKTKVSIQLAELTNVKAFQEIPFTDKAEYGFDAPQIKWNLTLSNGVTRTFALGDKALLQEAYYFLDEENDKIYLVDTDIYTMFTCSWADLVQKEDFALVKPDQIIEVTIEQNGELAIKLHYEKELEYPWKITTNEGMIDGDTNAVVSALDIFNSYIIRAVYEYDCDEFSTYGLETPATVVTVTYMDGEAEKMLVFEFGDLRGDSYYYLRVNGSPYVYGMSSHSMKEMTGFLAESLKVQKTE